MSIKHKTGIFMGQAGLFFSAMFYILFGWHQWWAGVSPRLIRGSLEREAIHHAHLNMGATLFVFAIFFLAIWLLSPGSTVAEKFKRAFSSGASTAVSLFSVFVFLSILTGLGQAWAKDESTAVFGVFALPHFLDWSWETSGYLHSSFSSISIALFSGMVFVYLFTYLTKHVKPGMAVALLIILHLLVNLPKPPSLHPIAAFGTYVLTPVYYFVALAIYSWVNNRRLVYWPVYLFFILSILYLPYFAFKIVPPWHQKAAAAIVLVEPAQTLSAARAPQDIFPDKESVEAAKDAVSWCAQCHNMGSAPEHLLGPNLGYVFNRQAGTAADYGRYSRAMSKAGIDGTFWTRESISEFLSNGQEFIPDNLMNQQTDLSDPVKLNQVIDYLEYISTD